MADTWLDYCSTNQANEWYVRQWWSTCTLTPEMLPIWIFDKSPEASKLVVKELFALQWAPAMTGSRFNMRLGRHWTESSLSSSLLQHTKNMECWPMVFLSMFSAKNKIIFYEAIAGCTRAKRKTTITREKQRNWKSTIHCSLLIKSPAPRVISPGQSAWQKCSLTIHPRRGWILAGNATFKHQMSPVIHQSSESVLACHVALTYAKQQWTERTLTVDLGVCTIFTTRKGDADIS